MVAKIEANIVNMPLKLCSDTITEVNMAETRLKSKSVTETASNIVIMPLIRPASHSLPGWRCPRARVFPGFPARNGILTP